METKPAEAGWNALLTAYSHSIQGDYMARKLTQSQIKSKLREVERKQKQAINDYNQEIRRHNKKVQQAVDTYNQEVRTYNSRVRSNRRRVKNEFAKLQSYSSSTRYVILRTSVHSLHEAYVKLDEQASSTHPEGIQELLVELSEKENANSLEVMNALLSDNSEEDRPEADLQTTTILNELSKISQDLDNRWRGAVYALNAANPDAARHFCTSAREIFTQILDIKAPDQLVVTVQPNCSKTDRGVPTRRSKIDFLLGHKGIANQALQIFIEEDINNILELFRVFNAGTHGSSGEFSLTQLFSIKARAEDGIVFLVNIASDN